MKINTFDPGKNKKVLVGEYNEKEQLFIKEVDDSHFMRKECGYGIQEDVLQKLKSLKCENIKIVMENKKSWIIPLNLWLEFEIKNYGNGEQRFMKLSNFKEVKQTMLF
jgi:hypothetical protein